MLLISFEKWNNVRAQQTELRCEIVLEALARITNKNKKGDENVHYEIRGGCIIK